MEGEGVAVDGNITALWVGCENSGTGSVNGQAEFLQVEEVLGRAVGGDGGQGRIGTRPVG